MNLADITTKPWILALFKRDDGERFLLGDGYYDFKDSLQHFQPNSMSNDIVELQGADGQLLAGQVRRSGTQSFDGYIGDGTTNRKIVEQRRKAFLMFFRKKHYYTVVYIFCDGTAIKRERGYLVDAPSVPEIRQKSPEYHVALNFENVNYYEYAENADGDEIYSNVREIVVSNIISGGLVWDALGAVSEALQWGDYTTESGSFITLNDAIQNAPMSLTQIKGNAEQTTYSGKNLIQLDDISLTNQSIYYYVNINPQINCTLVAGQAYTFSADLTIGGSVTESRLSIGCGSTGYAADLYTEMSVSSGKYSATFTPTSTQLQNGTSFYIRFPRFTTPSATGVNYSIKNAMLEKGSTATSYEQYVGGTPAPNPDYPQAIDVVTGEQTVGVVGKNLFDKDNANIINAYIDTLHTSITSNSNNRIIWVPCQPSTTYTLQKLAVGTSWITRQIAYTTQEPAVGVQTYSMVDMAGNDTSKTYTTGADARYLVVRIWVSGQDAETLDAMLGSVQLELGSTATTYEPYQGQSSEVNLGKNLFDKDNAPVVNGYVDGTGKIVSGGGNKLTYIKLKPSMTYTLTQTFKSAVNVRVSLFNTTPVVNATGTILGTFSADSTTITQTFTTTSSDTYLGWVYCNTNNIGGHTEAEFLGSIQVEAGSQATSYAEYFTPIELAKVGTYQDRIYKDGSKWYIEKQVGKKILSGVTWGYDASVPRLYTNASGWGAIIPASTSTNFEGISDKFVSGSWESVVTNKNTGMALSAGGYLNFVDTSWSSQGDAETDANNTTVYYALATPTDTEITDATLLAQLEHIYQLYGGVNNISIVGAGNGSIEISYATELNPGGGFVWEDGGTGGLTTITIDAVDLTLPVWTVTGPATNPTLSNITTGQTMSWLGTVPSGQTLIIDMNEQTATMAGANVYAFLSGNWVGLAPGTNRISYSVTGTDESSTLSWNNIVG